MSHEERIETLELRSTYQEDAIASLTDTVLAQAKRIEALEARLAVLAERLTAMADLDPPTADEERPPHW